MSKKVRRNISILIVIVMSIGLLAACAQQADEPVPGDPPAAAPPAAAPATPAPPAGDGGVAAEAEPPPEGAVLADHIDVIVDATGITVLNPNLPAGGPAGAAWVYRLVHDRLIEIKGPGDYHPGLAYRWTTEDFQTLRFYLRDDVYWHNGDHFTAECVVFTIEMAHQNPAGLAFSRWRLVERTTIIEPHIIELHLIVPNVDFEFEFSHFGTPILNERAYNENPDDPNWAAVGTGPFRLTGFATANVVHLERNDDYWGDLPPTQSMSFWTIPEMATRMVMLQTGDAQISFQMSPEDLDTLLDVPDFEVIVDTSFPHILSFKNGTDPIVRDPYFRRAVAHALNVEEIAVVAMGNWALPATDGNYWPFVTPLRRNDLPLRQHDLSLALEYLERSIWNGERVELATAGDAAIRASEMIQLQLSMIGVDVDVDIMDVPSFLDAFLFNPESPRQMWHFSLGQPPSAIGFVTGILYPGTGSNRTSLQDDNFTAMIHELSVEGDANRAREIAYEMQEWLWEDMSSIPLYFALTGIPAVQGVGGLHAWGNAFFYCLRGLYWDLSQTPDRLRP